MKKIISISALLLVSSFSITSVAGSLYQVTVTRRDTDIYAFTSGISTGVIVTKYCYELAFMDEAVLKYDPYSYDNKLIFSNGTSCDVKGIIVK